MSGRKRLVAISVVTAGITFPLLFVTFLLSTHGSIDYYHDYSPIRHAFQGFILTGILVLVVAAIDLIVQSRRKKSHARFPGIATWLVASVSIVATLSCAAYILTPQLTRTGDTPPQLILTESAGAAEEAGIAVVFWTKEATMNTLQWGISGGSSTTIREEQPVHHHWFQLAPLAPDTLYSYTINNKKIADFKSPPVKGKPLHFGTSGDSHIGNIKSNSGSTRNMLSRISDPANDYSMFFVLGDLVDIGFSDVLWKQAFTAMSSCSSSIPTYYVIGNHDALFGGIDLYRDYLCQPLDNDKPGNCQWKRIDKGNVHFLILDLEWGLQLYTPEQERWLHTQLESIPREDWCIVMSHTFFYCSGSFEDGWAWYDNTKTIDALAPIFEKYGVDLVFSGHKHHTELLQKNGVTYIIVGSFGGNPSPERDYVSPASVWYHHGGCDFADVTIDNNAATIIFRDPDYRESFRTTLKQ